MRKSEKNLICLKNFVNSWSGSLYNEYYNIEKEILSKYNVCKHTVFSRNDVSLAIFKLKIEKSAGLDKLTAESIKYKHPKFLDKLSILFTACCKHGVVPLNF